MAEGIVRGWIDPETGRWDWSLGRICWVDIETTNVWDPSSPPLLLEIAVIVTNADLRELGRYSSVVDYQDMSYLRDASPYAVDMHTKSGLWQALSERRGTASLEKIEQDLCQLLADTATDERPIVWAGASPSALDRPVVRHYMPTFTSMIHYRTIDISSFLLVAKSCGWTLPQRGETAHRAEKDAEEAIGFYRHFRRLISRKTRRTSKLKPAANFLAR